MRSLPVFALLGALAVSVPVASAWAADPPPGQSDNGLGEGGRLFISPSGEPFRGKLNDPYPVAVWFAQADANHDGRLDKDEFVADAERFFAVLDRDKNGRIEPAEVTYYEHTMVPEILGNGRVGALQDGRVQKAMWMAQGGGINGQGIGGMGRSGSSMSSDRDPPAEIAPNALRGANMNGAAPYGLLGEPEPVAASDLSFTGRISLADFKRRAEQRFDRLDKDKTGYLELASLPKTTVQILAEPRGGRRGRKAPSS